MLVLQQIFILMAYNGSNPSTNSVTSINVLNLNFRQFWLFDVY